jgi:Flp pilus assembly protein TadD
VLHDLTIISKIQSLAGSDWRQACDLARELVADNPQDESAALLLRDVVVGFGQAEPRSPQEMPTPAPAVIEAKTLIARGKLEEAEIVLRRHLSTNRYDPPAMHVMAEIAARCGLQADAERILNESARVHARNCAAMTDLGMTYHRIACQVDFEGYVHRAVEVLDAALAIDPEYEPAIAYKAVMFVQTRGLDLARQGFEILLELNPQVPTYWVNYGFLMKTVGQFGRGLAAYRTAVALDPTNGVAWWGLANLKVARFFPSDIEAMQAALDSPDLPQRIWVDIAFSLATALDQTRDYERAAILLREANRIRDEHPTPEAAYVGSGVDEMRRVYTREFFIKHAGSGDPRPDPIFIVGLPRAGSTLIEQILASHSQIEGTEELFALHQIEGELGRRYPHESAEEIVYGLTDEDFRHLGGRYLELAQRSRVTNRPFFTDKNPANWRYVGLIHSILPNAKIIDARRNPMDCCFANYVQQYQAGANFAYDQTKLGEHYSDYLAIMRHFDEVLPGRVYRVIHDDLIDNFEEEVRSLLEYIGVPFEESCLRFFETERPIHTPSSEQVRQPPNRKGFGRWRNYEPWLTELKDALGESFNNWRD